MYRFLRNTHLLLGLFSCLFVLMYGVSSIQFAHQWFQIQPDFQESAIAIPGRFPDARVLARELMDKHGLSGELQQIRQTDDGHAFRLIKPARIVDVQYSASKGEVKLRSGEPPAMGVLVRIHHIAGLWHETGVMNFWGLMLGIVSLGLIILGGTGIYLWFKLHTERTIGGILLGANLLFSLVLMILMRTV